MWRHSANRAGAKASVLGFLLALPLAFLPSTSEARNPPAKLTLAPNDAGAALEKLQFFCLIEASCPLSSENYELLKGAVKGDVYSRYMLGRAMIDGKGVPLDGRGGRQWVVLAGEAGFPPAVRYIEKELQNGENIEVDETRMANELKKQVDKGSTTAMLALAPMMIRGRGTPQDRDGGLALLLTAAQGGQHGDTEYEIGDLFLIGTNGLEADREEAMKWYAKAASRGNVPAMAMLGSLWENEPMLGAQQKLDIQEILRTGKIPEPKFKRNIVQSYCWRVRAALMDDFSAQYNLAMFRWTRQDDRFDNVIEADLLEADFWFRLGARDPDHDNSQVRGHIEPKMTTAQLEAVKKRVAGWKKLDFEQMKAAQIPIPGTSRTCDPMP